jgi:hypothetical protein
MSRLPAKRFILGTRLKTGEDVLNRKAEKDILFSGDKVEAAVRSLL